VILIVLAGLCLLSVPLAGGRLHRITELRLRALWLGPLALAIQLTVTTVAPGGNHTLHAAIHIATYVMIGVFLWANRRLPGIPVISAGTFMNGVTIVLNGGVMPASATAQRLAGLHLDGGFNNSAQLAHPLLLWLGDVIPVPGPVPNVLSVGDLVIFAGMLVLLHRTCGRAARPLASGVPARGDETPAQSLPGVQI
jgi:fermentation-respiration switch protein FrsA (DUF1100 family)